MGFEPLDLLDAWPRSRWYDPEHGTHGPRGGTTTVGERGLTIKKSFNLSFDLAAELAAEARSTGRSQAEILRESLRERYGFE